MQKIVSCTNDVEIFYGVNEKEAILIAAYFKTNLKKWL